MRLLFTIFIFFILSCNNNSTRHQPDSDKPSAPAKDGTAQMIDSLKNIYQNTNFQNHPYSTTESLAWLELELENKGGNTSGTDALHFAISLLKAGQTDRSIEMFEYLLEALPHLQEVNEETKPLHDYYAIAYMRKGEIDNCV